VRRGARNRRCGHRARRRHRKRCSRRGALVRHGNHPLRKSRGQDAMDGRGGRRRQDGDGNSQARERHRRAHCHDYKRQHPDQVPCGGGSAAIQPADQHREQASNGRRRNAQRQKAKTGICAKSREQVHEMLKYQHPGALSIVDAAFSAFGASPGFETMSFSAVAPTRRPRTPPG